MKVTTKFILFKDEIPEYGTVCKKGKTLRELEKKLKDKDEELDYLSNEIDSLEEEKEELEDECFELEEENNSLEEELKEVKKVSESRADLLIKAVNKIIEKDKLIKELRDKEKDKNIIKQFGLSKEDVSKIADKLHKDIKKEIDKEINLY